MATAIVSEIQENNAAISTTGTWTTLSGTQYSGGTALQSTTNGNTLTLTFTGRSLYVLTQTYHHNGPTGGAFTFTIDGNQYGQVECQNDSTQASTVYPRVLVPLARGLADASHTLVITTTVLTNVTVDSFLVVSGAKQAPTSGLLVCLGDSWTRGSGAQDAGLSDYPNRLQSLVQSKLGRAVTLQRKGVGGDKLHCGDATNHGDSVQVGGMYRTFLDVLSSSALAANGGYPEFLTYLFGANDLRSSLMSALDGSGGNVSPGTFGRHLLGVLCLLEDVLPVTATDGYLCKVAIGTPQYLAPWYHVHQAQASGLTTFSQGLDAFEEAVAVTRSVVAQFPWCRLAQVYEALDGRDYLLYPNAANDQGLHPNESGHGVVAMEFARALLGGAL